MRDKLKNYFTIPDTRRMIYDYIRVLSCMGIICLHTTGDRSDVVGVFFETVSRITLPTFVLLSGVLVLGNSKIEPYSKFYGRRFVKIVVPYLIYGAVYIGWVHAGHTIPEAITLDKLIAVVKSAPKSVILNFMDAPYFHLWFMLMIIGFYVVAPFMQRGLRALSDNDLKYLFVVIIVLFAAYDYLPIIGLKLGINNFFRDWIIYFIAGYILSRFDTKKTYIFFSVMGILSAILMFLWKLYKPELLSDGFYDLAPHMMMATCGFYSLMMLAEQFITKCKLLNWIIMKVSKYTFSIYMIHGIILVNYGYSHPGYALTFKGTITEVLVVFIRCFIFAVIFDNLITFNIQRVIYLVNNCLYKIIKPHES